MNFKGTPYILLLIEFTSGTKYRVLLIWSINYNDKVNLLVLVTMSNKILLRRWHL